MAISLKRLVYLFASALILLLAACSTPLDQLPGTESGQTLDTGAATTQPTLQETTPTSTPAQAAKLAGSHWQLASFEESGAETPLPAGAELTLQFDDKGQAGGSGGCNSFGAQYNIQGSSISFSEIISTMMACTDPGVMEREQRYLQALQNTGQFELSEEGLVIQYNNGASALHFVPAELQPTATPVSAVVCSTVTTASDPEWNLCRNQNYGFEVQFPIDGELTDQTETTARIDLPYAPGTNLTEKYMQIDVQNNTEPCSSPLAQAGDPNAVPAEPVQINGLEFIKQTGQGAATGNRYDWVAYSTSREDVCLSLSFVLHSFEPELVPTPPPRYDQLAESEIFAQIVESFEWLSNGTPPPVASQPTPAPQRIDFSAGATSTSIMGRLPASGSSLYVLRALEGQAMTLDLSFSQGQAILSVWGEDGTVLMSDHADASHFEGVLPATQDYYILLRGRPDGPTDYSLTVTIPPLGSTASTPTPEPIDFAPGATSATLSGHLAASGSHLYKLYALQGQTMTVELSFTQGRAILVIWGEDGTVLLTDHAEVSSVERELPASQYYYIQVKGRPDGQTDYSLKVTIPPA